MNALLWFWGIAALLVFLVVVFDLKWNMLRDISTEEKKPFSLARVQLGWWTVIVISSIVGTAALGRGFPTLWESTLVLLGISLATTGVARVIDVSDEKNLNPTHLIQNELSENFILDILSDANGVSIHRFQTVVFSIVFGVWFISCVTYNLGHPVANIDWVMPDINGNNLILLGLSSGAYAALKTTENKGR